MVKDQKRIAAENNLPVRQLKIGDDMRKIYLRVMFIALLGLSGCGSKDTPIEAALKEMWAEKADCSGRGFRITGEERQRTLQSYFNEKATTALSLNFYKIISDHQAQIGTDIGETTLLFDIDLKEDALIMSKPYFSKTPSNAFWAYLEETTGESPYEFMAGLTAAFDAHQFYRCRI